MAKELFFMPCELLLGDALVVLDADATVYYVSLGKWHGLVDQMKRDFRRQKDVSLKSRSKTAALKQQLQSLEQVQLMLNEPWKMDQARRAITFEYIFGTPMQRRVWNELIKIPAGDTSTYSEVGKRLGIDTARVVGNACGANRLALIVPCHRVLLSLGGITGYRYGMGLKKLLLDAEKRAARAVE